MDIVREEITYVPRTPEGIKFAEEYTDRLRSQGAFKSSCYQGDEIIIGAEYSFELKEDDDYLDPRNKSYYEYTKEAAERM